MIRERTKNVWIGNTEYQIGALEAADGSWLLFQILPHFNAAMSAASAFGAIAKNINQESAEAPPPESSESQISSEQTKEMSAAFVLTLITRLSRTDRETMRTMQEVCLSVCRRIEGGMPMPIYEPTLRRWNIEELKYDAVTVITLTAHTIVHNLESFFQGPGLNGILQSIFPGFIR